MMDAVEVEIEDVRTEEDDREVEPFRYGISSYGADYPVDSLVKRLRAGSIYVPSFQRGFVWDIKGASRFIESLLLGLPVPSIFLSKEPDSGKLLVVDGHQRLMSLLNYYEGIWLPSKREFALKGVDASFEGKTYKALRDGDRLKLDDAILHAIVFKQDEPSDDESSVYQVFERLNSGSKKLMPQEIRSAVHHSGAMRSVLRGLNSNPDWRAIYGSEDPRMRDQELVLRFLAFYYDQEKYERPLVHFLNGFMGRHKKIAASRSSEMKNVFAGTMRVFHTAMGPAAFRPSRALNAAVFDSTMVGAARRLDQGPIEDFSCFKVDYARLLKDEGFLGACGTGTANEERVNTRIRLAIDAFRDTP